MRRTHLLLLTAVVATLSASVAVAQQRPRALEYYENPPRPASPFTSPRKVIRRGPVTIYQVNVNAQGQNVVADAANEPSLALDPTNPKRLAIGWRHFDNISSNFRQAGNGYSVDGGRTWTFPDVLTRGTFRSDPVLRAAADGTLYYLSLQQTFFNDLFISNDFGASYTGPFPAVGGDKAWFTVDTSNSPGRGFLYQAWSVAGNNYGGRQFSESIDRGTTWVNPINIPRNPYWGMPEVGPNGELYMFGLSASANNFAFVRSLDAKNGGAVTWDVDREVDMNGTLQTGNFVNPGGLLGQANLVCDRTSSLYRGNIYVAAAVDPTGVDSGDIHFCKSTDGGLTWSAAKRINDDAQGTGAVQWFGTMSVAPNGRIDMIWNDTRNDPTFQTSQVYYSASFDGGDTWSASVAISDPFASRIGWPNQNKIGDYYDMTSVNAGAHLAFSATFNGEQDVYYAFIPPPKGKWIDSLTLDKSTQVGGLSVTATIRLQSPAPNGGVTLDLESNDPVAVAMPPTVHVPAGQSSAAFIVQTSPVQVSNPVRITASFETDSSTANLLILPPIKVQFVTVNPWSLPGGNSSTGTIHLESAAPIGGIDVELSSNNLAAVVPSKVTIGEGAKTATFTITTKPVASETIATIAGRIGTSSASTDLTIQKSGLVKIIALPSRVAGGRRTSLMIRLNGAAPTGGQLISLSSSNPGVATVPASVVIPAGSSVGRALVTTKKVSASTQVSITATAGVDSSTTQILVRR